MVASSVGLNDGFGSLEKVIDPVRIVGLLKRIQDSRSLLSIRVPGFRDSGNSAILKIHPEQGIVVLDEINPREAHEHFLRQATLHARARLQGVEISFVGALRQSDSHNGVGFYHIAMPEMVQYGQRRAFYRAQVGAGLVVPVQLTMDGSQQVLEGVLRDISVGGIGTQTKLAMPIDIQEGAILPQCAIVLPTGDKVAAGLEVRFIARDKEHMLLRFGGRFVDLDVKQQHTVERFVAYLDRLLRRKMARYS